MTLSEDQQRYLDASMSYFFRHMKKNVLIAYDLETNGLRPVIDDVLSISATKFRIKNDRTLEVLEEFNRYYYCSTEYNPNATKVNGLLNDDIISEKRNNATYADFWYDDIPAFSKFCYKVPNFLGHNCINFDNLWYNDTILFSNVFDTMTENRWTPVNETGIGPRLSKASEFYEVNMDSSKLHNADYDVSMVLGVFEKMLQLTKVRLIKLQEVI